MEKLLIYIKHHIKFVWDLIEWMNGILFHLLYGDIFKRIIPDVIENHKLEDYTFKVLDYRDLDLLTDLFGRQNNEELRYFKPHGFDKKSIFKTFKNPAFLMMGVFENDQIVGYFFLRCFWNKKCFVGRLVDWNYQGKGIGKVMNDIMYNIAWDAGFRCLSTISKNNKAVMTAHSRNDKMIVLKDLDNDYLLVEFCKR
jgi:hypothetical protein